MNFYKNETDSDFESRLKEREICIPEGITRIDKSMISSNKIETIRIPKSVISIEADTFLNCRFLKDVYYDGSVDDWSQIDFENMYSTPAIYSNQVYVTTETGNYADSIDALTIENVEEIKPYAFSFWKNIGEIILRESVIKIGECAFNGCSMISRVSIYGDVISIGGCAFLECDIGSLIYSYGIESWCSIKFEDIDANPISKCSLFYTDMNKRSSDGHSPKYMVIALDALVCLHSGISRIEKYAFAGFSSLKKVIIPNTVNYIGHGAFLSCRSLRSITISGPDMKHDQELKLCSDAFRRCSSIEDIYISRDISTYGGRHIFGSDDRYMAGTELIVSEMKCIPKYLFEGFKNLTSVRITSGFTRSIEAYAFSECENLISVYIGTGVDTIGFRAFGSCSKLEEIYIPNSIKNIRPDAFRYSGNDLDIFFDGTLEDWCKIKFNDTSSQPMHIGNQMRLRSEYGEVVLMGETLHIPDNVEFIGDYTLDIANIQNLILNKNIKQIEYWAISDMKSVLTNIYIPSGITADVGDILRFYDTKIFLEDAKENAPDYIKNREAGGIYFGCTLEAFYEYINA